MAIDLYMWLVLQLGGRSGRGSNRRIYWSTVQRQFEAVKRDSGGFARNFRTAFGLIVKSVSEFEDLLDVDSRWGLRVKQGYLRPDLLDDTFEKRQAKLHF